MSTTNTQPNMRKKRTPNAFMLFMKESRQEIKSDLVKQNGNDVKASDVAKEGGNRWRAIPNDDPLKVRLQKEAKQLKDNAPMVEFIPKKQKKDKQNKPKKLPSAYNLFVKDIFPSMKEKHPDKKFTELSKLLGNEWKRINASKDKKDIELREQLKNKSMQLAQNK